MSKVSPSKSYKNLKEYKDLLSAYQSGNWDQTSSILSGLLKNYPGDPWLSQFQSDFEFKQSMEKAENNFLKGGKSPVIKLISKIGLSTLLIVFLGYLFINTYNYLSNQIIENSLEINNDSMSLSIERKYYEAKNYFDAERYSEALPILIEIQEIKSGHANVESLIQISEEMILIEEKYQSAKVLLSNGNYESAYPILQSIIEVSPEFKDTLFIIKDVENTLEIRRLKESILINYDLGNWLEAINAFDNIRSIDFSTDLKGYEEKLFISYLNLIIDVADKTDSELGEIEKAQHYYQSALALLPQNKNLASERIELERTAIELIANKYYIYSINLLEKENYSSKAIIEAISLLKIAKNIDSKSQTIEPVIEKLELLNSGLDNYIKGRFENAQTDFEKLFSIDSNYADGYLKYLLLETYIARGDILSAFGEYSNSISYYELAETMAWNEQASLLQLFNVELKMSKTLKKQFLGKESAEYYKYSLESINFQNLVNNYGQLEIINSYQNALNSFSVNDYWISSQFFDQVAEDLSFIYYSETYQANKGESFLQIAFKHGSLVDLIRDFNNLGNMSETRNEMEILIPLLKEGN